MPSVNACLIVLAYRQEGCVEAACRSALKQTLACEIIFSDDCSPDMTGEVMRKTADGYLGPHSVRFRRSQANVGLTRHLQDAIAQTDADLIILQAGDDVSEPCRVAEIVSAWNEGGRGTALICSDYTAVNKAGQVVPGGAARGPFTLKTLAKGATGPTGATIAFTRNLISEFAAIPPEVTFEDRVLPFRSLLLDGKVIYVDKKLVRYCVEGGISRDLPMSMADYLFRFSRVHENRTLPDARLRLQEALKLNAPASVVAACERTVILQATKVAMSDGKSLTQKLVSALRAGSPVGPTLKHYLKVVAYRRQAAANA